ncbi:MAG: hypothetical protein ACHP9V_05310 [Terriglobales bacterium]
MTYRGALIESAACLGDAASGFHDAAQAYHSLRTVPVDPTFFITPNP